MDILDIDKPIKPSGLWNNINPLSKSNKEYKRLNKIWENKNSSHIDIKKLQITNILRITSHAIGVLITLFMTSTPWILPQLDLLMGIGSYSNNQYHFSWPDHLILTLFPMFGHIGLNLATKLGNYGKLLKYGLITIPILITSPYLILSMKYITKHKKNCSKCEHHSNKIQNEKVE